MKKILLLTAFLVNSFCLLAERGRPVDYSPNHGESNPILMGIGLILIGGLGAFLFWGMSRDVETSKEDDSSNKAVGCLSVIGFIVGLMLLVSTCS